MSFEITSNGGGFEKVVWENIVDTLPGGLNLDASTLVAGDYPDGVIPEGTPVAKNLTTGLGKVIKNADLETESPIGYTNQTVKYQAGVNIFVGVGISGTYRIKAAPADVSANAAAFAAKLPRITHV